MTSAVSQLRTAPLAASTSTPARRAGSPARAGVQPPAPSSGGVIPAPAAPASAIRHVTDAHAAHASAREVQAMLRRYGESTNIGRPRERLLKWATRLDAICSAAPSAEAALEKLVPSEVRRHIFLLEGISKLYGKRYGKPIERQYEQLKRLEDRIGQYTLRQTLLDTGKKRAMPAAVMHVFEKELAAAKVELVEEIEASWRPNKKGRVPAIAELVETVASLDWDDHADDKKYIRKEIARRLDKLAGDDFDMQDLESMHEFRRQLRWFSIYAEAVDGLIVLDERRNPVAAYEPLLRDPIATGPYSTLPSAAREPSPIPLGKSLYLANRQLSDALGLVKDAGEALEFTIEALRELGRGKSEAHREALKLLGTTEREALATASEAGRIYDGIRKNRLVEALRDEIAP